MKKTLLFLLISFCLEFNIKASGRLFMPALFKEICNFEYFVKAEVIGKKIETDSLGNNKISLVLLVIESFKNEMEDTIELSPVIYNNNEIYPIDRNYRKNVFMDIELHLSYYFLLDKELELSPYLWYNKIEIINNYLNYHYYSKFDEFLEFHFLFYKRKMTTEKFERKIRKRIEKQKCR